MLQLGLFDGPTPEELFVSTLNDIAMNRREMAGVNDMDNEFTERLWQRATLVRLAREDEFFEPSDQQFFDPPKHKDELVATSDYMRGLIDGDEGRSPLETPSGLRTREYYRGHAAGTERRKARHETGEQLRFQSAGMDRGAGCRVMRGSFSKGA